MLIDAARGVLSFGPWAKPSKDGWNNSGFNITFGSSDNWVLGMGRNTQVFGPDLKVIADWTYLEDKLINVIPGLSNFPITKGVIFGSGGATDLIIGNKGLLNYFGQNFTAERKSEGSFEYKNLITDAKKLEHIAICCAVFCGFIALLAAVITSRALIVLDRKNNPLDKTLITILQVAVPILETRWVGLIKGMEKTYFAAKKADDLLKRNNEIAGKKAEADKEAETNEKWIKTAKGNIEIMSKQLQTHPTILKKLIDHQKRLLKEEVGHKASLLQHQKGVIGDMAGLLGGGAANG